MNTNRLSKRGMEEGIEGRKENYMSNADIKYDSPNDPSAYNYMHSINGDANKSKL